MARVLIAEFGVIQRSLALASVSIWVADANGEKTSVLATLYQEATGTGSRQNPQALDENGQLDNECWVEDYVIAEISEISDRTQRQLKKVRVNPLQYPLPVTSASFAVGDTAAQSALAVAAAASADADATQTALDVIQTTADASQTTADAVSTAADVITVAGQKLIWQGAYSGATTYAVNDAVNDLGSSFICIQAGTGQNPSVGGTAYWDDLATKGLDGAGSGTVTSIATSGLATGGAITVSGTIDVPISSQLEAEAGSINTKAITPLRAQQNVEANTPTIRSIPQVSKSVAYTLVLGDAQKHILHPSADTTARIFTIPANAAVAFPIGTAVTFVNQNSGGTVTISITTDTLRLAGDGTAGSRTLAANGIATALKITSTEWIISGVGLT